MKKLFFIIIAVMINCVPLDAAQLTPAQVKAKKEIYSALKKYGTNITDDGEESLSFKYDGTTFEALKRTTLRRMKCALIILCLKISLSRLHENTLPVSTTHA